MNEDSDAEQVPQSGKDKTIEDEVRSVGAVASDMGTISVLA